MARHLAESENFKVISNYEIVDLHFKEVQRPSVYIGDFYGDPTCAMISKDEKYIVMGGCGLIIYNLIEPFEEFEYDKKTKQFSEFFRREPNMWWINGLHQSEIDNDWKFFRFAAANNNGEFIYKMNCITHEIEKIG